MEHGGVDAAQNAKFRDEPDGKQCGTRKFEHERKGNDLADERRRTVERDVARRLHKDLAVIKGRGVCRASMDVSVMKVMKPRPPSWMSVRITSWPKTVQLVNVSRTTRPVTQVALVEVNRASRNPAGSPREAMGSTAACAGQNDQQEPDRDETRGGQVHFFQMRIASFRPAFVQMGRCCFPRQYSGFGAKTQL